MLLALVSLGGCASLPAEAAPAEDPDQPQVLGVIETTARSSITAEAGPADGLARRIRVDLQLSPRDAVPLEVVATPPAGSGVLPAFVELQLAWQDYVGVQPTSWGRTAPSHLPFGPDGGARRGEPLERSVSVELEEPSPHVLARVIEARPRLRPVDLRVGNVHSGGLPVEFPAVRVATLRRPPITTLAEVLAVDDPDPQELFLAAAAEGEQDKPATVHALLDALAATPREAREAVFGALLFLTGTTNGRSEAQWRAWAARNLGPPPAPAPDDAGPSLAPDADGSSEPVPSDEPAPAAASEESP